MKRDWAQWYQRLASLPTDSCQMEAWVSASVSDLLWDEFLRGTPCGQYQQSGLWAEYKAGEGWHHYRIILTDPTGIVGGFQILWKKTRLGRIGYVSKGPVASPEGIALIHQLAIRLRWAARELQLSAMIVQQPDETVIGLPTSGEDAFIPSNPMKVGESTYLIDVRADLELLRSRMSASLRRNLRKGYKQQTTVREATEADLPRFFELMAATCQRQNTAPNPRSLEDIRRLWRIFSPHQAIRITMSECGGKLPAAKLSLVFGTLVTVWKKGWDGDCGNWHPNEILEDETLAWAKAKGARACDFGSFNRTAAALFVRGEQAAIKNLSSRDEYHLRFGGQPKLIPSALVFIPNPVFRWGYHNTYARLERARNRTAAASAGLDRT